ncbi:MAG: DEAD/DEAH box helicase [Symbiobacteriia bacterium]
MASLEQLFHPVVWAWFRDAYGEASPPQALAWPAIAAGENTLLLAPTGSGKTLAAFLQLLNTLYKETLAGESHAGVQVLYISPLKALNNDIHRNLEVPLQGIAAKAREMGFGGEATKAGAAWPQITTAVRTGDTPSRERQRMLRRPPQLLITTPESLYLLLTSAKAREPLRTVRFVIVDEVHALAGNKRGVHLSLSLERLEHLTGQPFQRIGLSATQRPLEEIAHFLGGQDDAGKPRSVRILDAGLRKDLDLRVVSPVPDLRQLAGDSVWPAIHQQLLDLIDRHRSTLVFTNNRRQAERLAARLNELAGTELARTHHGSLAREQRERVEAQLKAGELRCLVATSSLELGIDVGSIDLVVQIESPKGVARGLQRVGRAGHLLGAASKGRILPKTRADLTEAAAVTRAMLRGDVEPTRVPTGCLDVLAQQAVAMVAEEEWAVTDLLRLARRAYSYRDLDQGTLEKVLDMLAGRYASAEFREFRPRLHWDRQSGSVRAAAGSRLMAVQSGGTIPDKGLFTVVLADGKTRLGELDEEQVWETRVGDTILLGSASWRVDAIEHDRVVVAETAGTAPRVPFWRGDGLGRPAALGEQVGNLLAELGDRLDGSAPAAVAAWLQSECALDEAAAANLVNYAQDQRVAVGTVPSARALMVEAFPDEMGDWRLVLLSPYGAAVHAAWAMALAAWWWRQRGVEPDSVYGDDGLMLRFQGYEGPAPVELFHGVTAENVEDLILDELGNTSLFGSYFRYNAARALLLPRHGFGRRTPLWLQRLRSKDLLAVARRYPDHPLVLETYRECLQDVLEVPALRVILKRLETGEARLLPRVSEAPSPFAASLLFAFQSAFMYEYDRPKAERASSLLGLDRSLLKDLMGDRSWQELLDPTVLRDVALRVSGRDAGRLARTPDELVDLLARQGDLSQAELAERVEPAHMTQLTNWLADLEGAGRVARAEVVGETRWVLAEDLAFYRGEDGAPTLAPELVSRYALFRGPFTVTDLAGCYGWSPAWVESQLAVLQAEGVLTSGFFTPGANQRQWFDSDLLRQVQQGTLVRLRKEVEAVPPEVWAAFLQEWHGIGNAAIGPRGGAAEERGRATGRDALRAVLRRLQGLYLPAEVWEAEILPRRLSGYQPAWLDQLLAFGEVFWAGAGRPQEPADSGGGEPERRNPESGKVAFFFPDQAPALFPLAEAGVPELGLSSAELDFGSAAERVLEVLRSRGALFLGPLSIAAGLSTDETQVALWELTWRGLVCNDTFAPVRTRLRRQRGAGTGRWSLLSGFVWQPAAPEARALAWAEQLLSRHGIVSREMVDADTPAIPWPDLLAVFKEMEVAGRVRRGYFVKGLSGLQFAAPEAVEALRRTRARQEQMPERPEGLARRSQLVLTAACDPATGFGTVLPLPDERRLARVPGQFLISQGGRPLVMGEAGGRRLTPLQPLTPAELKQALSALPQALAAPPSLGRRRRLDVEWWGDQPILGSDADPVLSELGFDRGPRRFTHWPKG